MLVLSQPAEFPTAWIGKWQGMLEIYTKPTKPVQITPMQLHILPTDSAHRFDFTIIYGKDTDTARQKRTYMLICDDSVAGNYRIDEKNSIILRCKLLGNSLISRFSVMGNYLTGSYTFEPNEIIFQITSGSIADTLITGGGVPDIPLVRDNAVSIYQTARLKRISN
jgi:hypothetical protein